MATLCALQHRFRYTHAERKGAPVRQKVDQSDRSRYRIRLVSLRRLGRILRVSRRHDIAEQVSRLCASKTHSRLQKSYSERTLISAKISQVKRVICIAIASSGASPITFE